MPAGGKGGLVGGVATLAVKHTVGAEGTASPVVGGRVTPAAHSQAEEPQT